MKTTIYCKAKNNFDYFFMFHDGYEYYLFAQNRRKGVEQFYKNGVILNRALHHGFGRKDRAIHRTMDKLKSAIQYIENENGIIVLEKTKKHKKIA